MSLRALQIPRLSEPTCITCLQSGRPDWPAWETPLGDTSHLAGGHHELSAVLRTSPSPAPLSHALSALPEPCCKRDRAETAGKPTWSSLPPCKVGTGPGGCHKILTVDAEGGAFSWFSVFQRHQHPWSGGQASHELCSSSAATLCNLKGKKCSCDHELKGWCDDIKPDLKRLPCPPGDHLPLQWRAGCRAVISGTLQKCGLQSSAIHSSSLGALQKGTYHPLLSENSRQVQIFASYICNALKQFSSKFW